MSRPGSAYFRLAGAITAGLGYLTHPASFHSRNLHTKKPLLLDAWIPFACRFQFIGRSPEFVLCLLRLSDRELHPLDAARSIS